jgi:AbrB family looped-hinge helix DNA binding protein
MTRATVTSRGHVAIPKSIRERLNLEEGTQVVLDVQGEALVLTRLTEDLPNWRTTRGMFRGECDLVQDLAAEHAAERARDDGRTNQGR